MKCARCGCDLSGGSDDRAAAELERGFPGFKREECAVVCDDCYAAFWKWMATQDTPDQRKDT